MYFHLDRTPACRWRGDSPNLLSCLSTTVLTLTFEESLCGSQLLNHIVEDTSRVKHRLDRVLRDLFKVVRGRWWSEESVPVKRNDSKYWCLALTPSPIVVTLLVFQSYCAPPPVFHLAASQWSILFFFQSQPQNPSCFLARCINCSTWEGALQNMDHTV